MIMFSVSKTADDPAEQKFGGIVPAVTNLSPSNGRAKTRISYCVLRVASASQAGQVPSGRMMA
jgi:hypothetical protein